MNEVENDYNNFYEIREGTYFSADRILSIHTVLVNSDNYNGTEKYFVEVLTTPSGGQDTSPRFRITQPVLDKPSAEFQLLVFLSKLDKWVTRIKEDGNVK